jgi:hypothetical protein
VSCSAGISDLLSPQAWTRLAAPLQRRAADDASAALREALVLAGADPIDGCEVEALFDLLERIEQQ